MCSVTHNLGAFMTVYAEHLIAQHELSFSKVFSQQYVLSKEAGFAVTSFAPHTLHNGQVLHVGRGLQVALATDVRAGISVAVLGLAWMRMDFSSTRRIYGCCWTAQKAPMHWLIRSRWVRGAIFL